MPWILALKEMFFFIISYKLISSLMGIFDVSKSFLDYE